VRVRLERPVGGGTDSGADIPLSSGGGESRRVKPVEFLARGCT